MGTKKPIDLEIREIKRRLIGDSIERKKLVAKLIKLVRRQTEGEE